MDPAVQPLSTELMLIGWSVVLLLAQIVLQAQLATHEFGLPYAAGPRDEVLKPMNVYAGRAERALRNLLETYPAFIALALALAVRAETGGWGTTGAWLWLAARIVYLPLYMIGTPFLRTIAWAFSAAGLILMLCALLG